MSEIIWHYSQNTNQYYQMIMEHAASLCSKNCYWECWFGVVRVYVRGEFLCHVYPEEDKIIIRLHRKSYEFSLYDPDVFELVAQKMDKLVGL